MEQIINNFKKKFYNFEKIKYEIPGEKDLDDYLWIDKFINNIKQYIYIREDEKLLIILPNQVYQLNDTAVSILSFLLRGNSLKSYIKEHNLREKQVREISNFICDLRSLLIGCFKENDNRRAIEYVPYNRYFYIYPILSELAITYACNAACAFCYIDCNKNIKNELSTNEAKEILLKMKMEARVPSTSFTGGEPTLRNDLLELIKYAREINLRVNLITNGINITESYAKKLKKAGLNSVQVSLEAGEKDIHEYLTKVNDSFNKTLSCIRYLKEADIFVHTNTTINKLNKESLLKLVDIAEELKTNRLSMNMLMPCGNAINNNDLWISYSEIGEIVKNVSSYAKLKGVEFMWYSPTPFCLFNPIRYGLGNKTCAAAHGLLSIDPIGNIIPCSSLNVPVGNFLENSFNEIWFSEKARYYRFLKFAPDLCKRCSIFNICGSACPIYFEKIGLNEIEDKNFI